VEEFVFSSYVPFFPLFFFSFYPKWTEPQIDSVIEDNHAQFAEQKKNKYHIYNYRGMSHVND
jgi:hypothetical protein